MYIVPQGTLRQVPIYENLENKKDNNNNNDDDDNNNTNNIINN